MREKLTVLLIEDNPGDARLIREFLAMSGGSFHIEAADRLSTGLARLEAQTMDAVLLDLSLPDSSGFDTFARLHAQAPWVPIIVMTGLDDEALAEEAVRAGAQDYLVKGQVDGNLLARSIRYAVERKRAEEALRESEARYRALFESARDAIFIMDYDRFIDCNLPAMKLFGGDQASVIGQPPYEVFSPPAQPDGRPSKDSALEKIEAALGGVAQFFEWKHRRIDGDLFDAEVSLSQVEIGRRFYLQAIVRDITTRKQAEIALAQERLLLRTVIDNLPDAIYAKDLHGRKMLANRADLDNIGKPEAEVLGKTDAELFPPQVAAHFEADDQTVLQAGQPVLNREELLVNREGRQIWQLTSKLPLKDVAGQIVGLVGIGRDITERKRAEAALRALSARQEALLAAIPDIILEVNTDKVYTWANQAGLEFFGEDVLGKEAAFYFEGEQTTYAVVQPLFNGAESTIYVESWQRRKDGQKRLLAWWCRVLKDDQGNPTGALSSARDITEHEQMEEALREAETKYRTLVEQIPAVVYMDAMDDLSTALYSSPQIQKMSGYSPEEWAANPGLWRDLVHPQDRQRVLEENIRMNATGGPFQSEYRLIARDGRVVWVHDEAVVICDSAGQPQFWQGILMDITDRKQMEEALQESEERYRQLVAVMPVGVAVHSGGRLVFTNPAGARLLGAQSPDELIGKPVQEIVHPEQWEAARERIGRMLAGEKGLYPTEDRYVRLDGTVVPVEVMAVPLIYQGKPAVQVVVTDITERKQMEKALRDKVTALQTLAEIDREIIAATEPQGILNLVCRRATELVHAQKSAIALETSVDGMALAASYGLRDPDAARREFTRHWQVESLHPNSPDARHSIALNDVSASSPYMPEFSAREDIRAVANVPLVVGEARLGVLVVFDTQPREWTADELQTLDMLAGQTAVALEKVRLYQAAQNRATQLAMLNDIGQALTSTLDLDRVLALLLDKARHSIGAEACSVALMEAPSGDLLYRQAVGQVAQSVVGLRLQSGQGIAGWVASQRQSALVPDAASDPRFYRRVDDDSGFATRDVVCVPLVARDAVVGVIELLNKVDGRFDSDDVRLLESVAAQAAIAIENARLFETESAGRQRLQTLYRIGQTLNSTLNAAAILDRLTDEAMRVTQATHGAALVARPDLGCFERRSLRGYSPELAEQARTTPLSLERGVNGRAYQQRRPVYVRDVRTDPEYFALIPETRSELAVPVMRGGQVIANLDLQSPQVDAFHAVGLDFMQALTDQVAIALENARLYEAARRRLDEIAIVSQVALLGAAGRPVEQVVERSTTALTSLWPDSNVSFMFVDEQEQMLVAHPSSQGLAPDSVAGLRVPLGRGITGWVARERQPLRVGDVTSDSRYFGRVPGTRSEMAAPLVVGERVIGVVNVESPRPDAFSGDDLRLLATLAGQLATIFEKVRLDAALVEHAAQLEQRVQERTAEIRQQQARTQAILDAVGEGVIVTNLAGDILYVNSAAEDLTGYSAAESIGQNPRLWQSGQTSLETYQAMWRAILAGETWRGEIVNRNKQDVLYEALLTIAPIRGALDGSRPAGFVGVQRDISERKRAEQETLRALEKERELGDLKSSFVSLTSHEFRTPLTTILSSAEMLEHYGPKWTEERKREHLRRIQAGVKYMTSLLEDILVIGKAEANKIEFAPAPLDLVQFCRELVDGLQLADSGRHELIFSSRGECAQANMDESLLRHILSNLLSNAIKYSPPKSRVLFDLVCQDGQAVFQVQDSGIGIPPEDQLRLFETFHRAGNARNIPGTGLGLAIVKRSVDLHGGEIKVESQVGVGTKITVTLPLGTGAGV